MPANVGEMFYTGAVPWHGKGLALSRPASLEEALKAGGLNWNVGKVDLLTADDPPSPVQKRQALVRLDRPAGDPDRVVGVAHRGFAPVQNRDAGMLFDAIFGQGRPVYHTGGYLGIGEVVWLLARIGDPFEIGSDDVVEPYALMANSHDGSMAFCIRLTSVRVVCQNTLSLAMAGRSRVDFRRAHQGTFVEHAEAAQGYFSETLQQFQNLGNAFVRLSKAVCPDRRFEAILEALLPESKKPARAAGNPGLSKAWENRAAEVLKVRAAIRRLRAGGRGADLHTARGSFWGVLNAVIEYVDHEFGSDDSRLSRALLGDGMDLKLRAFKLVQEEAKAA